MATSLRGVSHCIQYESMPNPQRPQLRLASLENLQCDVRIARATDVVSTMFARPRTPALAFSSLSHVDEILDFGMIAKDDEHDSDHSSSDSEHDPDEDDDEDDPIDEDGEGDGDGDGAGSQLIGVPPVHMHSPTPLASQKQADIDFLKVALRLFIHQLDGPRRIALICGVRLSMIAREKPVRCLSAPLAACVRRLLDDVAALSGVLKSVAEKSTRDALSFPNLCEPLVTIVKYSLIVHGRLASYIKNEWEPVDSQSGSAEPDSSSSKEEKDVCEMKDEATGSEEKGEEKVEKDEEKEWHLSVKFVSELSQHLKNIFSTPIKLLRDHTDTAYARQWSGACVCLCARNMWESLPDPCDEPDGEPSILARNRSAALIALNSHMTVFLTDSGKSLASFRDVAKKSTEVSRFQKATPSIQPFQVDSTLPFPTGASGTCVDLETLQPVRNDFLFLLLFSDDASVGFMAKMYQLVDMTRQKKLDEQASKDSCKKKIAEQSKCINRFNFKQRESEVEATDVSVKPVVTLSHYVESLLSRISRMDTAQSGAGGQSHSRAADRATALRRVSRNSGPTDQSNSLWAELLMCSTVDDIFQTMTDTIGQFLSYSVNPAHSDVFARFFDQSFGDRSRDLLVRSFARFPPANLSGSACSQLIGLVSGVLTGVDLALPYRVKFLRLLCPGDRWDFGLSPMVLTFLAGLLEEAVDDENLEQDEFIEVFWNTLDSALTSNEDFADPSIFHILASLFLIHLSSSSTRRRCMQRAAALIMQVPSDPTQWTPSVVHVLNVASFMLNHVTTYGDSGSRLAVWYSKVFDVLLSSVQTDVSFGQISIAQRHQLFQMPGGPEFGTCGGFLSDLGSMRPLNAYIKLLLNSVGSKLSANMLTGQPRNEMCSIFVTLFGFSSNVPATEPSVVKPPEGPLSLLALTLRANQTILSRLSGGPEAPST
eukprot:966844_1